MSSNNPPTRTVGRKITRGGTPPQSLLSSFSLSFLATVWTTLIAIVTVPAMLHGLGIAAFGIYSVAFSVVGLGAYLDLGLGWSTTKFVAEANAKANDHDIGAVIVASACYHLVVGLIFTAGIFAGSEWIVRVVLQIAAESQAVSVLAVRIAGISFLASSLCSVFVSALRGLRQFSAATLIATGSMTLSVLGAATAVSLGFGLTGAAVAQASGAACGLVAGVVVCWRFLHAVEGGRAFWQRLRGMLQFSLWTYLNRLMQMLVFQADKIIMARVVGAAAFPFYSVPFNLAQRLNVLALPAVSAFFPIASERDSDREIFLRQYLNASRLVHVITGALAIVVLCIGDRILLVWIGPDMAASGSYFLRVLTVGFWINSVWSLDAGCIEGWNRPWLTSLISAIALAVGMVVTLASWKYLGAGKAIALGVATDFAAVGVGLCVAWHRMARYSGAFVLRRIALPVLEMGVIAMLATLFLRAFLVDQATVILGFAALTSLLVAYGIRRSFTVDELRALRERVLGHIRVRKEINR